MNAQTRSDLLLSLRAAANTAANELEAWLDRYPPGYDRPDSWHDEYNRLDRAAQDAHSAYAETAHNVQ